MTRLRAVAFSRFDGDKSFKRRRKAFGLDSRVPLVGDARDLNPGVPFFREISIYYPCLGLRPWGNQSMEPWAQDSW